MSRSSPATPASRMSHTPGPWRRAEHYRPEIQNVGTSAAAPYVLSPDGRNVAAAMIGGFDDMAEVDANACLIAAAPDLLAACQKAKKFLEPDLIEPGRTVFWELVAAIKKARGE